MDRGGVLPGGSPETGSDSSVQGLDSFGNDNDDIMGHEEPIPVRRQAANANDGGAFPVDDFITVVDGLGKSPSWTVFPIQLANCLAVSAQLIQDRHSANLEDLDLVRRFIREGVPGSFDKCLDDSNLYKWSDDIQINIFDAVLRLIDLLISKLVQLQEDEANIEEEEDVNILLRCLTQAFSKGSCFHDKHSSEPTPAHMDESFAYAEPQVVAKEVATDGNAVVVEECMDSFCWLVSFLNYMGDKQGFSLMAEVLGQPENLSISLIRSLVQPISQGCSLMTMSALMPFRIACRGILQYIIEMLETDVEELSIRGADFSFNNTSHVLSHIYLILEKFEGAEEANKSVSEVRCHFILKMLGYSNFNKHLSAVRETFKLLKRADDIREIDGGSAMKGNILWLEQNGVIKSMLRGSLHQKQYVDQVQRILQYLVQEGCMTVKHLDILWNVTEKADTFETVKNNVYSLLVDLSLHFSSDQLDLLFQKFESANSKPASDRIRIAQLLFKIAQADIKGVMAKRLVSLLWNIIASPDAPVELVRRGLLADAAALYEARGVRGREQLCRRCLELVKAKASEEDVLRGLFLLRQIIGRKPLDTDGQASLEPADMTQLLVILVESNATELILKNLEEFVASHKDDPPTDTDGSPPPQEEVSGGSSAMRLKGISERTQTLIFLFRTSNVVIPLETNERLWACLVADASLQDKEFGFTAFQDILAYRNGEQVMDNISARAILANRFPNEPAALLSESGFACFQSFFLAVGFADGKLIKGPECLLTCDMELVGLPYLWEVATQTKCERVATFANSLLISVHTNVVPSLVPSLSDIKGKLLERTLEKLTEVAATLIRPSDDAGVSMERPQPTSSNRARDASLCAFRCTHMVINMLERCSSRAMPLRPSHLASYAGNSLRVEVTCNGPRTSNDKFSLALSSNDYAGHLRHEISTRLDVPMDRVRLMHSGHEILDDSKILRTLNVQDGHAVSVAVSSIANTYSRKPEDVDDDLFPVEALKTREGLFKMLLDLADADSVSYDTQNAAQILLYTLPTCPSIQEEIRAILQAPDPLAAMKATFATSRFTMHMLYRVQTLLALLHPSNASLQGPTAASDSKAFLSTFSSSGCLPPLLRHCAAGFTPGTPMTASTSRKASVVSQLLVMVGILLRVLVSPRPATSVSAQAEDSSTTVSSQPEAEAEGPAHTVDPLVVPDSAGEAVLEVDRTRDSEQTASTDLDSRRLDAGTLQMVALHLMAAALSAGLGWASPMEPASSPRPDFPEQVVEQNQVVVQESLRLLVTLASQGHPVGMLMATYEHSRQMVATNVFHSKTQVRQVLSQALQQIYLGGQSPHKVSPPGDEKRRHTARPWLLSILISARDLVDSHPFACGEFFQLLVSCVQHVQTPAEVQLAEALLQQEVTALSEAKASDDERDLRLLGHLRVTHELVKVLSPHGSGARSRSMLLQLLVNKLLFPEAAVLRQVECQGDDPQADLTCPEVASSSLHTPCDSAKTRQAALDLLKVVTSDPTCMAECVRLLTRLHLSDDPQWEFEYQPSFSRRGPQRFCGLKNAGATCYMNATIQQLFMTSGLRHLLLRVNEIPEESKADNVLYQLQVTFAHLALSSLDFYVPRHFWQAYKDYDGEPINLREHQDAFEFLTRLQDLVDQHLSDTLQTKVMKTTMGGKFAQQVICKGVSYRSETEQDFMGISVDVRGKPNLLDSLESYVQGELMEGENAYFCEEVGRKVDAVKRACIKTLPNTLIIHLKRFEFDFDTMLRWKIRDRFEFPTELNMYSYTVEGLEEAEGQKSAGHGVKLPEYYDYELVGIVVHSGTAFVGHYYSYIKERAPEQGAGPSSTWWSFDDNTVEPWDPAQLDRDCFGGKNAMEVWDNTTKQHVLQEYDRPNSAYLLVYERRKPLSISEENNKKTPLATRPAAAEAIESSLLAQPDINKDPVNAPASSTAAAEGPSEHVKLEIAGIGPLCIQRSIYKDVMIDNLRMIDDMHRLDSQYLKFMRYLVEAHSDISQCDIAQRKLRRTELPNTPTTPGQGMRAMVLDDTATPAATSLAGSPPNWEGADVPPSSFSGQRGDHADKMAVVGMRLGASFLLKVYLRAHHSLRDDMAQWRQVMESLMTASSQANSTLIRMLLGADPATDRSDWLLRFLMMCPSPSVRGLFGRLVSVSVATAFAKHGAELEAGQEPPAPGSVSEVAVAMIDKVLALFHEFWRANTFMISAVELFRLMHSISQISSGVARYMLDSPELMNRLAETINRFHQHYMVNSHANPDDLMSLLGCLSRLMRASNLLEIPGKANKHFLIPPPAGSTERPGPHFGCSPEVVRFLTGDKLFSFFAEGYLHCQDVVLLLQARTWEQPMRSQTILQAALEWLAACTSEDLKPWMDGFADLVSIQDQYIQPRLKLVLGGTEHDQGGFGTTLLEQILGDVVANEKRYYLIQLVVLIAEKTSMQTVKDLIHKGNCHRDWQVVLSWLEEKLGNNFPKGRARDSWPADKQVPAFGTTDRDEWTVCRMKELVM